MEKESAREKLVENSRLIIQQFAENWLKWVLSIENVKKYRKLMKTSALKLNKEVESLSITFINRKERSFLTTTNILALQVIRCMEMPIIAQIIKKNVRKMFGAEKFPKKVLIWIAILRGI